MSVERIIEESINKNPLGLKEAFIEALKQRVDEAIQSKIDEASEEITEAGLAITHGKPTSVSKQHSNSMRATVSSGNLKPKQKSLSTKSSGSLKPIKHESVELEEAKSPTAGTRLISKHEGHEGHHAEVRYDKDNEEYQVHHYLHGKHMGEGPVSYHGSGKEGKADATNDAEHLTKHYHPVKGSLRRLKEEVELDEASVEKLKSYVRKARDERDYPTPGKPTKDRSAGVDMAGKKVWEIGGKAKVKATSEEVELDEADHDGAVKAFLAKGGKVTKVPEGERDPKLSATFKRTKMAGADKAKLADPNKEKAKSSKYKPLSLIAQAHQDWKMKKESAGEDNQE